MSSWYCCRTCLSTGSLKLINIIARSASCASLSKAVGLQIRNEDELPKKLCTKCLAFVKRIIKFQKMCEVSQKQLMQQLKSEKLSNINIKLEPDSQQEMKDHEFATNNMDFDTNYVVKKTEKDNIVKFESTVDEVLKKQIKLDFENQTSRIKSVIRKQKMGIIKKDNDNTELKQQQFKTTKIIDEISNKNDTKTYKCEHCHKILKSNISYIRHKKIHSVTKLVCEHCGLQFMYKRKLLMHCKAKHGYQKTDKCSYCDWMGNSPDSVKIHERIHTGEKPYVCHECGNAFHRKSTYLQHVAIHLPEKTVKCDQCPALFKSVTLMRIHKTRHKPRTHKHKCLMCGTCFTKRDHCYRHLQRIHGLRDSYDTMYRKVPIIDEHPAK